MMWHIGKPVRPEQKYGPVKRLLTHVLLLLILWLLLMFVVIPWDTDDQYPSDSFGLIEGQRAYVAVVRESRPNLITTLRGLNMVHAQYTLEQFDDLRQVRCGNVEFDFEPDGSFISIRIVH